MSTEALTIMRNSQFRGKENKGGTTVAWGSHLRLHVGREAWGGAVVGGNGGSEPSPMYLITYWQVAGAAMYAIKGSHQDSFVLVAEKRRKTKWGFKTD